MSTEEKKNAEGFGTTGHSWDGIEEWNNPMPRWWVWTFYITIIWAIGYVIAYPAWPLINGATSGLLGYSTRAEVAAQIAAVDEQNAELREKLASVDLTTISEDTALHNYAKQGGAAVFRNNCAQCHGSGANGIRMGSGYPNLLDDDWLWGGSIEEIAFTIRNGVRNEQSDDAHINDMPAFGDDWLEKAQIDQVVNYVLKLSGQDHDAGLATQGATIFLDECSSCHMEDGTGDSTTGAPNLADAIWLFGGDAATITETVTFARGGVMPAWAQEFNPGFGLSDAEINAVAAYVHQLGGGQ